MSRDLEEARLAGLTAFATLGALSTAQHLVAAIVRNVEGAEPELVAEESMALLAIVTARTLRDDLAAARTVQNLPLTYRDYVVGTRMVEGDPEVVAAEDDGSYERIARKMAFYEAHFPAGKLPGPRLLSDKMELWMGRVSPPRLPESPAERLQKLELVGAVETHLKLVRTAAEQ